jgi:nitrogen regulatory protein PII
LQRIGPVDQAAMVIDAVIKGARTGQIGDGRILIAPIEDVV